jgi:hypothetical protein
MSIAGISAASSIYASPANAVNSPQSQAGAGFQHQHQTRVYDLAPTGAKGAAIEETSENASAAATKLGSIIDVTV